MSSDALLTSVQRYLQNQVGGATDAELLARYAQGRDEAAFAAVVHRYGGLVLGVARRQLADRQQAEDVFQATFLALARSANRVGQRAPLANWLYTVALRQARKARLQAERRKAREQARPAPPPTLDPLEEISGRDLLRVVDEELARLPEKYRLPVLLCCVRGLSREEAARQLGWPAGVVKGRLERGRQRLAARLTERGLAPAALVLAPLAAGAVPGELLARTTALSAAPWSSAVSATVRALAASSGPRRLLPAVVLCCALAVAGLTALALGSGEEGPPKPPAQPPVQAPALQPAAQPADDPLPVGSTLRLGTSRYRQGTEIRSLAVSADGTLAVAASGGHIHEAIRVFDLTTGRVRATLGGPGFSYNESLALSPDGQTLASAEGGKIHLRDPATGKELRVLSPPTANPRTLTEWIRFSPDGKTVAVAAATGNGVHLVELATGKVIRTFPHKHTVYAAAFSPDGKLLAVGGHDREKNNYFGRLWEVETGKELGRFPGGTRGIRTLAFSPDGKTLAVGGDDARLRLWDVAAGKVRRTFPPDSYRIRSVAFTPDGKTVAAAGDSLRLYDPATGKERLRIDRRASSLHFSADGKVLTAAVSGSIHRWDPATGRQLTPQASDSVVDQILVTPDGRRVITRGQDGDGHLWDARTGAHLRRLRLAWQRGVGISPDGRYLVWPVADEKVTFRVPNEPNSIYTGNRIRLYDLDADRFIDRFPGFKGDADHLAFMPGGKVLVTVDYRDGAVRLWDVATGKEQRSFRAVPEHEGKFSYHVWRAVLSPDGKTLAVTYQPTGRRIFSPFSVRLWDMATGKETHDLPGHFHYVGGLAFSPDSRLLVSGSEPLAPFAQKQLNRSANQVYVWEVATGKRVKALPDGLPVGATCVAFAPDGRTVATAQVDGTIKVWETATWKERVTFRGHRDRVTALTFAADGRLLSGGLDTTVLVWDVRPRRAEDAGRE